MVRSYHVYDPVAGLLFSKFHVLIPQNLVGDRACAVRARAANIKCGRACPEAQVSTAE